MRNLCVLGSTGSIGVSTLDVCARHRDALRVVALTANNNVDRLFEQCLVHKPKVVAVAGRDQASALKARLTAAGYADTAVEHGPDALVAVASLPEVDTLMAAIVGAAGLLPTLAAARLGKRVLLANKEALVMSGPLFMAAVRDSGAELLPIDSEHNAIFQCMPSHYKAGGRPQAVRKILLTASGGPLLNVPVADLDHVTPEQAIAHPNWVMGRKISVDSATMMNKGLEVIEACLLFSLAPEDVQVVIHPQSVIHSMVDYVDGSVLAQLGNPDMRTPIAHALAYPERFESGVEPLDMFQVQRLDFQSPDFDRFPCLGLAYRAVREGGTMPAILNAANEKAVASFLDGRIRFTLIAATIRHCMDQVTAVPAESIDRILDADRAARAAADAFMADHAKH